MVLNTFGTHSSNSQGITRNYMAEMQELIGLKCPISTTVGPAGNLIGASYETSWREGGTTPVKNKKGNIASYKSHYENKSLTKEQIKTLDKYIADNIKTE